ncbi:30S ribosomal protein S1 [Tunturiibacter gelidoferens]|uniref:Small ribosomal subunit protein bS1 n=1 Tax=Tunturiibacter gelidiferens TaxID=3069689 RepID=A0A9X0QH31_9BACT|nr:30S ribosomal protein S1 [Edaphobacter lichenicola]MBB5330154.1 small subunit ribosomal protein S1 [Edaphobacter lichenicola]
MSNPGAPESTSFEPVDNTESTESFDAILAQYEQTHSRLSGEGGKQITGTVVAVSVDSVFVDIGYKTEGVLPLALFQSAGETVEVGSKLQVSVKGRNEEGYYELSRMRVEQPKDWSALEKAFADKAVIVGTVTGVVKGGLTVDVGVRAFMPGSRSGARDAAEMEKLVGQEIRCRIIKLDATEEDVVVDRRAVAEEDDRSTKERRYAEIREGDLVSGTVRSVTDYGAFVDIGGVDGLLHISDISWARVEKPSDVLTVGQQVDAKVLKVEAAGKRISLGMKQLLAHPWDAVAGKYVAGERVRGAVTRVTDFGAFVELEPGVEGMVHISEMSWVKKVRKPGDLVKPGDVVEVMILGVSVAERRMSLGLKQTLGDPWVDVAEKFAVGSQVEGPVTSFTKFGAFVQLVEGVEGMIHVSEITAEKRIERPQDVLRVGQVVKAKVLDVDREKRQIKLSMKQLVPTGLDEYIAEHHDGELVTGRLIEVSGEHGTVELGEGIRARAGLVAEAAKEEVKSGAPDLSSFSSMLAARWKNGPSAAEAKAEPVRVGQIRSFRITLLDREAKKVEVQLV